MPTSDARNQLLLQLGKHVHTLTKQMRAHYDEQYVCLTPALDQVLAIVANEHAVTVSRIADLLMVSPGAATQHIAALEKEGAVTRLVGTTDRREVRVQLTPEGTQLYAAVRAKRLQLLKHMFGDLEIDELEQLCDLLAKVTTQHTHES